TIILGGGLPSSLPEFSLRKTGADIAICGEAEFTIPYLMSAIAGNGALEDVAGLAFFRDGQFVFTGKPNVAKQVTREEIGWPAWDLFPMERYITTPKTHPFNQRDRLMTISTGRGCPFKCNFCYRIHEFRQRPAEDVLDEMEYLIDRYKLDGFYFLDDLVMLNSEAVSALCEGIINRKLKIRYNISGRLNIVNPEIIKLLKESGCLSIFYGIESGNQEILDKMGKRITLEQIYKGVALTREAGIFCEYGFMFGQPGENEETLNDTLNLIKNLSQGEFTLQGLFGCIPFPGTQLYEWCKQTGRIKDDEDFYNRYTRQDWFLDQLPVNMTDLSDEKANELFHRAKQELKQYYYERIKTEWPKAFQKESV
ncbi:MAG: radical SAM protein, partial [Candidatus Margulisiibacteriota bacterium]